MIKHELNPDEKILKDFLLNHNALVDQVVNVLKGKSCIVSSSGYNFSLVVQDDFFPRIVTPVVYQQNCLGIMIFITKNQSRKWHSEEINLVEGIASQIAPAIYQAELFKKLENQKIKIEETLVKLKNTQAKLIQSEKMASLGQLVAGVAHEINTPLGAVNSNNDIILKCIERIKDAEKSTQYIDILEDTCKISSEATRRINKIVKSLKNFARLDEAELKRVDIHEGILSTLTLINHELKNRIEVVKEFGDIPKIECYPDLLNQVFMNILVNSVQSIPDKGNIKITTEMNNDFIKVIFSDSGKGIHKDSIDKIFDPGFTTKKVGTERLYHHY